MEIPWDEHETAELADLKERGAAAAAELFSRYQPQLLRMIQVRLDRRLYGRVDPADVLQDSYLEIARRLDQYLANPTVPFFVWLRQMTAQTAVDLGRQHLGAKIRDARQEVPIDARGRSLVTSDSLAMQLIAGWTSPSQAAVREETYGELRKALESMDEIDREILAMRHFEELSNNDVAKILGLQKSAASNRYIRALQRLKQILSKVASHSEVPL